MTNMLSVLVTAYCLAGNTFSGLPVHYGTIAVDPNVIPLGTKLFVPGYGRGRATDTGGSIRGYHIDVWMADCKQALVWGSRLLTIRIRP